MKKLRGDVVLLAERASKFHVQKMGPDSELKRQLVPWLRFFGVKSSPFNLQSHVKDAGICNERV